jgi:hypothetical protein
LTTERTTYEPPLVTGILSAIVAIAGIVIAAVSLILFAQPPTWLTGWYRLAPLATLALGVLLALRYTRDDRDVAGRIANLEMDCADYELELVVLETRLEERNVIITGLRDDVSHLKNLLANPLRSITITDRSGTRTEPLHARNLAWTNAVALVRMTDDFGILPGREPARLTRESQAEAIQVLQMAKVITTNGNLNRLTVPVGKAIDALNWLAPDTTPPAVVLGNDQLATSGLGLGEPSVNMAGVGE